jgi:hypothetical protein
MNLKEENSMTPEKLIAPNYDISAHKKVNFLSILSVLNRFQRIKINIKPLVSIMLLFKI